MNSATNRNLKRTALVFVGLFATLLVTIALIPVDTVHVMRELTENETGLAIYYALLFALAIEYINSILKENKQEKRFLAFQSAIQDEVRIYKQNIRTLLILIETNSSIAELDTVRTKHIEIVNSFAALLNNINSYDYQLKEKAIQIGLMLDHMSEYRYFKFMRDKFNSISLTPNPYDMKNVIREVLDNGKEKNI